MKAKNACTELGANNVELQFDGIDIKKLDLKAANCSDFAIQVIKELHVFMETTEKCIQIIDASFEDKNYVYALNASRELLDAINESSFWLFIRAPEEIEISVEDEEVHSEMDEEKAEVDRGTGTS